GIIPSLLSLFPLSTACCLPTADYTHLCQASAVPAQHPAHSSATCSALVGAPGPTVAVLPSPSCHRRTADPIIVFAVSTSPAVFWCRSSVPSFAAVLQSSLYDFNHLP
ncbi:hypothetical protein U1Q18_006675, partial [Sarracenia purpurea var. burkii]